MKPRRPAQQDHRPGQSVDAQVEGRLLGLIRGQFCPDLPAKEWYQHVPFLRVKVVLWPARFITGKGFTVPESRYEDIMRAIFTEIKRFGQTGQVRYWPGYLTKCVQDHWKHHWEEYYAEAKSARTLAETILAHTGNTTATEDRSVEAMAAAHKVLVAVRKKSKVAPVGKQITLFPL